MLYEVTLSPGVQGSSCLFAHEVVRSQMQARCYSQAEPLRLPGRESQWIPPSPASVHL